MKENTRNLLVGLTVIFALVVLGGMILLFQELPGFLRRVGHYEVQVVFPETRGVQPGADVRLYGKRVGRITQVDFTDGDPTRRITVTLVIDADVRIPGNVNAYIGGGGFAGAAVIDLKADGHPPGLDRKDPAGRPLRWLPQDGITITGREYGGGGGLLPAELIKDVRDAMASFKQVADSLNSFFRPGEPAAPSPTSMPSTGPSGPARPAGPPSLPKTLTKLDAALDAITDVLGDKDNQANIRASLANLKTAAAATGEAMEEIRAAAAEARTAMKDLSNASKDTSRRFDTLAGKLIENAGQLGKALTAIQRAANKVNAGEGTLGKLVNDPALYNNLVDASTELKKTLAALTKLLDKWKAEGLPIKLK